MKTQTRHIPEGSRKLASKKSDAVAYLSTRNSEFFAVGYFGKAVKPTFNYRFRSVENRDAYVCKWLTQCDAIQARRDADAAAKKAALAKPHGLVVGDVLYCSWGYDQTTIDYYQVTALVGARSVTIRKIAAERVDTASMQGMCVPAVGHFIGEAMTKRVNESDRVKIYSFASAGKLEQLKSADGLPLGFKPKNWSSYA
jgi:hypothetical protein